MLTEDVAPETKDCNLGRFGSGSSGCLVHSELAAVGSKSERISASHTDVAQRMRPISRARDMHMYALGSRDSAAAIVREQQRGAAPRRRAIGKALVSPSQHWL